ncbi:MAG: hypothetical protein AAGI52_15910 [Bacteroidota bacterium]
MRIPRRFVLRALVFPVLLGAVLLAMKTQDGYADIAPYWDKLQDVRRVQPEVVFLGSSRTFRHIDPVRLDSLRADGVTSYNFGVQGSRSLETHFRADRLLEMDLPVQRMIIEFGPVDIAIPERAATTRRIQHYHDARRATIGTQVAMASGRPFVRRVRPAANRWRYWTRNTFLVGWGRAWANAVVTERQSDRPRRAQAIGRRGYVPLGSGEADQEARREAFLSEEGQEEFAQRMTAIRARESYEPTDRDRVTADAWIALAERASARGVEVIYVEQVGTEKGAGVTRLVREALGEDAVIVLNDPARYPELFETDAWFDVGHLREAMALRSTDILAAELPLLSGSSRLGAEAPPLTDALAR